MRKRKDRQYGGKLILRTAAAVLGLTAAFGMTAFGAETGESRSPVITPHPVIKGGPIPPDQLAEETGPGAAKKSGTEESAEASGVASEILQPAPNGLGIVLEELDASKDPSVTQLVVVVGTGMDSSKVKVGYYTRQTGEETTGWTEQFCVDGYCGHNGMAVDKREGDRRTPVGTYSFTQAFGSLEDPGSRLPYKQLDDYDYWVDDGNSAYYNQMVSAKTVKKDWNSAEHLIGVMPQYRYAIALNYNTENRTPGLGSAIFIHGYHTWKTWTEGCIAIPEENMKTLVQQADAGTRIVIMPQAPQAVME